MTAGHQVSESMIGHADHIRSIREAANSPCQVVSEPLPVVARRGRPPASI